METNAHQLFLQINQPPGKKKYKQTNKKIGNNFASLITYVFFKRVTAIYVANEFKQNVCD